MFLHFCLVQMLAGLETLNFKCMAANLLKNQGPSIRIRKSVLQNNQHQCSNQTDQIECFRLKSDIGKKES